MTFSRIGGAKSRSGCKTCKTRKVKCGEEKPSCLRCSSTGRKCEYGSTRTSSVLFAQNTASPSCSLLASPNSSCHERRAFAYYVQHASKGLSAGMNLDFWTKVTPQICRTEPAVWDAIISISVLYEHPDQCLDFPLLKLRKGKKWGLNQIQRDALTWYSRAISSIHSQIAREAIQGRVIEALQLYEQGALLLEKTVIPLFLRLGSISLTVSTVQFSEIFAFANHDLNTTFTSLDAARTAITVLFSEVTILEREAMPHRRAAIRDLVPGAEMLAKQQSLQTKLNHWHHAYTNLCRDTDRADPLLLAYHAALSIYISTCLSQRELVYDSHMSDFAVIVENASLFLAASGGPDCVQPPFTFEMGLGLPLFLTAVKCRDPHLRRKALQLLRQAPPIQALFTCTPVALMAEKCMKLEEDYNRSLALTHDPQLSYPSPENCVSDSSPLSVLKHESTGFHCTLMPEEARICYYNVLQPGVMEGDPAEDGYGPSQIFEAFRNHFDTVSNTWCTISHRVLL
ncbi:hypothetical protein N7451_007087 [Penicillium sp. IBT 35674x]|nr:hypothetical protein N7451_007087 [Penicillium sp. IBT 35674x]